jgi:hypothetical protein
MLGVVARLASMAVGGMLVAYFIVGRGIFSEFGVITIGALMLPVVTAVIYRQWRVRKTGQWKRLLQDLRDSANEKCCRRFLQLPLLICTSLSYERA